MDLKLRYFVTGAVLIAIIAGLAFISGGFYSISSDETSRTLISYYWYKTGQIESTSWLPFHFYLTGTGFILLNDLILLPRFITLFFGALTILSAAMLSYELSGNKTVTALSAAIVLLIPQRIILSVVPLPEIIFISLVLTSAYFFIRWLKEGRLILITSSALLIAASTGFRYEGWIFAFIMFLYIFTSRIKPGIKTALLIILAAFPVYWLMMNYTEYGNLFYFMREPEIYYAEAQDVNLFNSIIFNPFTQFAGQLVITFSILGIAGIYMHREKPLIRKWLYVFFIPLLLFSIISFMGNTLPAHNFWRTSAVWIFLVTPFTAYLLYYILKRMTFYRTGLVIVILFFMQLINSNFHYLKNVKPEYCLTGRETSTAKAVIDFMKINAAREERILIENVNTYEHFDISLASQDPMKFIFSERNSIIPSPKEKYTGVEINYFLVRTEPLKKKLLKNPSFRNVGSLNGWVLFKKNKMITGIHSRSF